MRLTVNDFRQTSCFADYTLRLDSHQRLKRDQKGWVQPVHSLLHQIPMIRQLPCLRQQRLSQRTIKSALMLAIAQEYGTQAVYSLN
ncbi:hypothetical protein [unidentified bacterial endosymbiont]|uniref:hypothetical protein n=1 Tax=unidentified bacterial endosymbiont TaxID=2355 RepID=UPI0020A228FC|nr:hypothetical protein [unidentified bacterial endosymbiont]